MATRRPVTSSTSPTGSRIVLPDTAAGALPDVARHPTASEIVYRLRVRQSGDLRDRTRRDRKPSSAFDVAGATTSSTTRSIRPRRTVRTIAVPDGWCRHPLGAGRLPAPVRARRRQHGIARSPFDGGGRPCSTAGPADVFAGRQLVAYARIRREGAFQLVVANADGSGNERAIGPKKPGPCDGSDVSATWAFAPDGTGPHGPLRDRRCRSDPAPAARRVARRRTSVRGEFEFVDIQRLGTLTSRDRASTAGSPSGRAGRRRVRRVARMAAWPTESP